MQKWLYLGKVFVFWEKLVYSGKSGCNWAKVVVFGKRWLYLVKIECNRAKVYVFVKECLISGKKVVIVQKWFG